MAREDKAGTDFRFDRMEFAGSLGDLGALIPIAAAMILMNGLQPSSVLLGVGCFYLLAGFYYRLPIPVQPLKVVGALVIAAPEQFNAETIAAAGILFGAILLALSLTGAIKAIGKYFTKPKTVFIDRAAFKDSKIVVLKQQCANSKALVSSGTVIKNHEIMIFDHANNRACNERQIGEILVTFIMQKD